MKSVATTTATTTTTKNVGIIVLPSITVAGALYKIYI